LDTVRHRRLTRRLDPDLVGGSNPLLTDEVPFRGLNRDIGNSIPAAGKDIQRRAWVVRCTAKRCTCNDEVARYTSWYQAHRSERSGSRKTRGTKMAAPKQLPYVNTSEDTAVQFLSIPTLMRSTGETTDGAFALRERRCMRTVDQPLLATAALSQPGAI
jgi:hypothetical protein